jgi:hypothetical protein
MSLNNISQWQEAWGINKKYPFALGTSPRNNIEWNYILLPFQNGILCITQNIPIELYSNVAPIILERKPHCERTIQKPGIEFVSLRILIYTRVYIWQFRLSSCNCQTFFLWLRIFRPIVLKKPSSWLAVKFYASIDGKWEPQLQPPGERAPTVIPDVLKYAHF